MIYLKIITLIAVLMSSTLSLLFMITQSPMTSALIIVAQTLLTFFITYTISHTSWFSFILLMIFLSGMMILFIYVSSLSNNSFSLTKFDLTLILPLSLTMWLLVTSLCSLKEPMNTTLELKPTFEPLLTNLYSTTLPLTIIVITVLFLALLVAVKTTRNLTLPLRSSK